MGRLTVGTLGELLQKKGLEARKGGKGSDRTPGHEAPAIPGALINPE
jgi:hypothetical protein